MVVVQFYDDETEAQKDTSLFRSKKSIIQALRRQRPGGFQSLTLPKVFKHISQSQ
jgi:hypothetical protein